MQIEVAEFGKMSQSGNSLLKLIQNNDLPILDLLVREAVQNSLDAGMKVEGHDSVHVDIGIKDVDVQGFSKHLDGITERLIEKFGDSPQKAIYIEDANTTGLTGSLDFKHSPNSNIFKLIYGISMAQETPGAGGSWGLGKTVYFRVGIGLVVYYSHILNEDGQFQHRLAVTLVENEKLPNTIIPEYNEKVPSGIAWWGQRVSPDSDDTIPITDETMIRDILHSLSIKPFEGERLGTKIIIPFIDEQQLLIKHEINPDENKPWETNVADYIGVAMQRWYAPRLANKKYSYGKFLDGHINGKRLDKDDFLPLFLELQLMYNAAAIGSKTNRYMVNDIQIRNYFEHNKVNNAGRVAYKKFTKKELDMLAPLNGPSPYTCVNEKNPLGEQNAPLMTYVRRPGMIINYETDGEWCKGLHATEENEYLVAIFVPNSNTKLMNQDDEITDLEAYLRKSEMADHTSWTDIIIKGKPFDIVEKIRSQVRRKIKASFENKEEVKDKQGLNTLARNVGKMLLPPTGFGRRASSRNRGGGTKSAANTSSRGNSFTILSQKYLDTGDLEVHFQMKLSKSVSAFTIELFIASEGGKISASDWESDDSVGTPFPAKITRISFPDTIGLFGRSAAQKSDRKVLHAVRIEKIPEPVECSGILSFNCTDPHVQVEMLMKPEGSVVNGQ
ncbi:hypothetical protein [Cytobacillus oceanisediminis]|uniref:Histidine kinase/DNA gyrase B/HSP90-like ATPase n=1 Tax=Cytobacillus oceanisediminis TaxID=665099 RepID=A0ABX3CZI8_9BACI|nr:hypothetical protein [Cytobacillus oceanisediminis]OHX50695.1 hypothetical protein BBV17_06650 [Cytobacillus oceanisediminis]